jgi:hypothetical protein
MTWTVSALTGEDGELIERLCYSLHQLLERAPTTAENIILQVGMVIGAGFSRSHIQARDFATIESAIARRGLDLVESGVSETFLVRALRDDVTRNLDQWTDVEAVNRKRAEALGAIGDQLSQGAVASLQPVDAEQAADGWAANEQWRTAVGDVVSDAAIEEWADRHLATLARSLHGGGSSS